MKVSISCITYNHAPYIRECIEGFLMQKCNFDFEILIHDDASTDGTQDIIKEYQQKYPDIIKPIFQTENQYSKGQRGINIKYNFPRAKGKYIALCEGDDYWTDPLKLQKQVDFLEGNEDCVLCFAARDVLENGKLTVTEYYNEEGRYSKSQIPHIYVPTLTAVFRNVISQLPVQMNKNLIDASLFLFLSQFGSFYFLRQKVAVYRVHEGGVYSGNPMLINYRRSVNARIAAWRYLKDIDREAVTENLLYYICLQKEEQRKQKKYLSLAASWLREKKYRLYLTAKAVKRKYKK